MPVAPADWSLQEIHWHCNSLTTVLHDMVVRGYETRSPHIAALMLAEGLAPVLRQGMCAYDIENIFDTLDAICFTDRTHFLRLWDGAWILKLQHLPPSDLRVTQGKPQRRHALMESLIQRYCSVGGALVQERVSVSAPILPRTAPAQRKAPRFGKSSRRFHILHRDDFTCRLCGRSPANTPGTILEVDHITPHVKGGNDDPINLWTLCFACNRGKGTQEL